MIILPDRNIPRAKLLLPMLRQEWRTPSQAQRKDQFGNENNTRFRLRALLNDGFVAWTGWFDDREDADAFLFALASGSLRYERELWDLPTPAWRPDIPVSTYDFVTDVTLTTTGSNTWSIPSDCVGVSGLSGEFIDCIGAGGSGGTGVGSGPGAQRATGAGGGAWSRITTLVLTASGSASYTIGTGGTAVSGAATNGNDGGDTWFNNASFASASVGAKGGVKGLGAASTGALSGGAGGDAASRPNSGSTSGNSGGRGGNVTGTRMATGGGGSAGPNGAGNQGADVATIGVAGTGGSGDAGSGGAGGATNGGAGGNGAEYDASYGSGGGGGGGQVTTTSTGGAGGTYGGAGGCGNGTSSATSGAGRQGLIRIAYTPFVPSGGGGKLVFNMPMLGM